MKIRSSSLAPVVVAIASASASASSDRRPRQAPPGTPWEDLRSGLSSPDILNVPTAVEWREQCLDPLVFDADGDGPPGNFHVYGYDMGFAPSGVCMIHMSCLYPGCEYKFATADQCPAESPGCITGNSALSPPFDASDIFEDDMELPAAVLHPKTASDVVKGVQFARDNGVGISVKVVGHSYFGSSTAKGTLLIKMSTNYPTYAIDGSLTECANAVDYLGVTAGGAACDLATARGKKAYIRVGGGELFDLAYRAVFFDWNENQANLNKYHFVGGYCGTVSAAGGWVQSGGLSGASMRLHGLGIDQVLHVEMVTPKGVHVRFGPTMWEEVEGYEQPKTTEVTGYCNSKPHEDESLWEWTECEEEIDFEGLWFAVRGGGGGTFGIVTSLYYQLQDQPGSVQLVAPFDASFGTREDPMMDYFVLYDYMKFVLTYLFLPERLNNVSEVESRSCNAPNFIGNPIGGYLDVGIGAWGNVLYCHNSAGEKFIEEWKAYVKDMGETGKNYGDNADFMAEVEGIWTIGAEFPSQGYVTAKEEEPYKGRLKDDLGVQLSPLTKGMHHIPLHTVLNYLDELVDLLVEETILGSPVQSYLMGGAVSGSTDQMDSLSPLRRDAAVARTAPAPSLYGKFYDLVWRDMNLTTDSDFPGIYCHNHAANNDMGPLKDDWSAACPSLLEMSQEEREEKCVSQAESFWGTANVARLESVKKTVDPDGMFICNAGIGASSPFIGHEASGNETAVGDEGSEKEDTGVVDQADESSDPAADETKDDSGSPAFASFYSKSVILSLVLAMSLVL